MHLFFPCADTLKHIGSEVVVLHVFDASLNDFAQVVRLCASWLGCEVVKPLVSVRRTHLEWTEVRKGVA